MSHVADPATGLPSWTSAADDSAELGAPIVEISEIRRLGLATSPDGDDRLRSWHWAGLRWDKRTRSSTLPIKIQRLLVVQHTDRNFPWRLLPMPKTEGPAKIEERVNSSAEPVPYNENIEPQRERRPGVLHRLPTEMLKQNHDDTRSPPDGARRRPSRLS